jgi:hypothetical protein
METEINRGNPLFELVLLPYIYIHIISNFIMEGEHIGLLVRTRGNESKL